MSNTSKSEQKMRKFIGSSQEDDEIPSFSNVDSVSIPKTATSSTMVSDKVYNFPNANVTRTYTEEEVKKTPASEVDDFERNKMALVLALRQVMNRLGDSSINKDIRFASDMAKKISECKKYHKLMQDFQKQAREKSGIWTVVTNQLEDNSLDKRDLDIENANSNIQLIDKLVQESIKRYKKVDEQSNESANTLAELDIVVGVQIAIRVMKNQDAADNTIRSRLNSMGVTEDEVNRAFEKFTAT
jgi:hypothetical protein